jgi:tetratricopeptide (TPR) repeat protein
MSFVVNAQDIQNHIIAVKFDILMDDVKALKLYKQALVKEPSDVILLCKCSELSSRIAARIADKSTMTTYHLAARSFALKALQVNPLNSEANFVMALVEGRDALVKSGKQKIDAVKAIRKFALLSIHYDAANYKAWHVMGKWYAEISDLNIFERSAVKLFFGGLPEASLNDAIIAFEKSKHLNPGLLLNYLELAKAYKKNSEENKAKQQLTAMLRLPVTSEDDPGLIKEAAVLLKKWEGS